MTTILYYVSSHGFGHSVRSAEVIKELAKNSGVTVVIRTAAPNWLFPSTSNGSIVFEPADVDAGPVQIDSMTTNLAATLESFSGRMAFLDEDAEREIGVIKRWSPSVIVSDIAPLGVEAGARAAIPTVVVANFLWDWILGDYAKKEPEFEALAGHLKSIYTKAAAILKTGLSGGFEDYDNIVEIPLIAGKPDKTREEARLEIGLSNGPGAGEFMALVSLGGSGLDRFFRNLDNRISSCSLMILGEEYKPEGRILRFDRFKTDHSTLLSACDGVIGKMGYGLCSELIATRRPLLYTARNDFIEFKVLKEETSKYIGLVEVPEEDFFSGNLDGYIDKLKVTTHPEADVALNGAQVAAENILKMAS